MICEFWCDYMCHMEFFMIGLLPLVKVTTWFVITCVHYDYNCNCLISNLECLFLRCLALQVIGKNYPFHQCEGYNNTIVLMHTQN